MQFGRCRRVLQMDFLLRENKWRGSEGGQCRFMETGQDQFFLARIDIDVTDSKNTWNIGHEFFGIDNNLPAVDFQSPVGNRAELRRQSEKDEKTIQRQTTGYTIQSGDLDFRHDPIFAFKTGDLSGLCLHAEVFTQRFHFCDGSRCGTIFLATV